MVAEKNDPKKGNVFVISAPSGAGKTSVVKELIKRLSPEIPIKRVVTYTTRPPRSLEENGKDYYFVSHEDFENKRKNGFFLETTEYNGKLYGSPTSILPDLDLGTSFIFVTDIEGVKNLSKLFEKPTLIWLNAPSFEILKQRIISRGTESAAQIEQRLKLVDEEMKEAHKSRLFDYNVTNDDFETTVKELSLLIKNHSRK